MANFDKVTSTVCGASTQLNELLNKADEFADDLINKLEEAVDPSQLITDMEKKLKAAEKALKDMLPDLPTLKELGLQDELDALKAARDNAVLFAEKLIALQLAFGSLDFEKLMEIACEADNKKVINGEVVTKSKNVTGQSGTDISVQGLPESLDNPFAKKTGAELVATAREKTYTESVAKIQDATVEGGALQVSLESGIDIKPSIGGYTLTKSEEDV